MAGHSRWNLLRRLRPIFLLSVTLAAIAWTDSGANAKSDLESVLAKFPPNTFFADATAYDAIPHDRPVRAVKSGDRLVGYVFLNTDFDSAIGYSGKPITILIAIDPEGTITGAKLVHHSEPIVLAGIPDAKIEGFIEAYKTLNLVTSSSAEGKASGPPADIVSGATVTVLVIDDSIRNSVLQAARILGIGKFAGAAGGPKRKASVITSSTETFDWTGMVGDGSVRRLKLTAGDINKAFAETGDPEAIAHKLSDPDDSLFIELYAASLAVPAVAKSLLGEAEYSNLVRDLKEKQQAILVMGRGPFSFKGSGYVRGGIFDRIQIVQGGTSVRFRDRGHKRIRRIAADGAPDFKEVGIFRLPEDARFNPAEPWRLQLLVPRQIGALKKVFTTFELGYRLPPKFVHVEEPAVVAVQPKPAVAAAAAPASDLWKRIWKQKKVDIVVLSLAIGLLTVLFFFQDKLVKYPKLTRRVRTGFLLFTLIWIGWYAQAQLSVVNVLVFANALLGDFRWEFFLREPLIFILWCSVAASLLFWGRGAYCGWLCPFGALQELTNGVAKFFKVPQIKVPWAVHERAWPIKYLIFLGLLGFSIYSLADAERLAEVEPFKTAIVLRFLREWPFVTFAVALLVAGLFIERFYCRYMCPLGGALAIPGKLAMFNWLKRYRNCGDPCHICAQECMVQAITPMGDINPNECLYCLHCQVNYNDGAVCPVVILKNAKSRGANAPQVSAEDLERAKDQYRRPRKLGRAREIEPEFSTEDLKRTQGESHEGN